MDGQDFLKCQMRVGCHGCVLAYIQEDMRLFRAAVNQFITEGNKEKMLADGHSILKQIDAWYEPKTEV